GTGSRAKMDAMEVAGRTGTAQFWRMEENHKVRDSLAWFAGFAPFKKPRYAFAVLVCGGDTGGRVSAPLAKEILRRLESKEPFTPEPVAPAQGHLRPIPMIPASDT
ncbi:MAG TPA: penicillin-binding transpeptidase domain-containing protein, partial [Chthoniobacterales bacterium]